MGQMLSKKVFATKSQPQRYFDADESGSSFNLTEMASEKVSSEIGRDASAAVSDEIDAFIHRSNQDFTRL